MDYQRIYQSDADAYDALIAAEDCDHVLLPALRAVHALEGADVVDIGCGTGRIARMVAPLARSVALVEPAIAMLDVARTHLADQAHCAFHNASADALPLLDDSVDVAVAAWVFGHQTSWNRDGWRTSIGACLGEMSRVLRVGGHAIVLDTLGTGHEVPRTHAALDAYYAWLQEQGFTRTVLRTDYSFDDVESAARICGGFFGPEMAARILAKGERRVPECTALFARRHGP
jgi:ubiquinone/menaquinone biosynthesis C-methylase UbiE